MKASRIAAVASVALFGTAAAVFAQSPAPQGSRTIEVPSGAVVLVLPAGSVAGPAFDTGFPFPDMPSPVAMIRQMDQMMANMQRGFAMQEAAMRDLPQIGDGVAGGAVSGVVVTSFSNGHGTCTQRITYSGNGAAPIVQTSSTGDGCAGTGTPASSPELPAPKPAAPHLIEVQNHTHKSAPLVYAQAKE
jgi:hypothetical protein